MVEDSSIKKMAEYLLSGATMLAYHCPNCSLPIFRKDNKAFCPECGEVVIVKEGEEEKKKTVESDDSGYSKVIISKREELLERLKTEKDIRIINEILDAIRKINELL